MSLITKDLNTGLRERILTVKFDQNSDLAEQVICSTADLSLVVRERSVYAALSTVKTTRPYINYRLIIIY